MHSAIFRQRLVLQGAIPCQFLVEFQRVESSFAGGCLLLKSFQIFLKCPGVLLGSLPQTLLADDITLQLLTARLQIPAEFLRPPQIVAQSVHLLKSAFQFFLLVTHLARQFGLLLP